MHDSSNTCIPRLCNAMDRCSSYLSLICARIQSQPEISFLLRVHVFEVRSMQIPEWRTGRWRCLRIWQNLFGRHWQTRPEDCEFVSKIEFVRNIAMSEYHNLRSSDSWLVIEFAEAYWSHLASIIIDHL